MQVESRPLYSPIEHLLRADALSATMLIVIGAVGTLSCWASIGYLDTELDTATPPHAARGNTAALVAVFLAAMSLAVLANNLGIVWVAIEATTVATAFLVGHRRTRTALEATWKYVIICSVGIACAFLGTVLLYFAARHAGAGSAAPWTSTSLRAHAAHLDPAVTRLAAGLLLIGYGTKAGLVPFHTWLADAHSQAPAPGLGADERRPARRGVLRVAARQDRHRPRSRHRIPACRAADRRA